MSGCSQGLPSVRVTKPVRADVEVKFLATGATAARQIEIAGENFGTLEEILVQKDDRVKRGQILALAKDVEGQDRVQILLRDIATQRSLRDELLQRLELRRAQLLSENEQRSAERRRAQALYRETVADVSPEKLQQAEATVDEAQAQLRQSRRERERLETLFKEDIVSQAQVEKAQMEEEISLARRTRAIKQLEELEKGATKETIASAQAQVGIAEAGLDQNEHLELELSLMEQQLRTKELEITRLESELSTYQQRIARGRLISPIDGQVTEIHRFPGEMVHRGTPILTLLDPKEIWVEGEVAEQDSSYVSLGQAVTVRLPSFENRSFPGKIESMGAALRTPPGSAGNARFLPIKVKLDEKVEGLKSGIEADIEGSRTLAKDVLTVTHQAVIKEGPQSFLVTVQNASTQRIPVELGVSDSDKVEIRSGLSESQLVVIDQPSRLSDGTQVDVQQ